MLSMTDKVRIDKWLWAARFFKTRAKASEAIAKNRIRIDGQRIKPSRSVAVGDIVTIEKLPYAYIVTVRGLNDQRRSATEAQLLYEETAESIEARAALRERLRHDSAMRGGLAGDGRPSKKQRRQIIRFQNQNDEVPHAHRNTDHDD